MLKLRRLHDMALSDQMDGTLLAAHPMPLCTQMWRNLTYNGRPIMPDLLLDLRQYTLPGMGTVELDYVSFKACSSSCTACLNTPPMCTMLTCRPVPTLQHPLTVKASKADGHQTAARMLRAGAL